MAQTHRIVGQLGFRIKSSSLGTAPTVSLIWVSGTDDTTPDFAVLGSILTGDVLRLQYDDNSGFTSPAEVTHTITSGDMTADEFTWGLGTLSSGTYYFRVRIERSGYTDGSWSNIETVVIA